MLNEGRKKLRGYACECGQGRGRRGSYKFWMLSFEFQIAIQNPTSVIKKSFHLKAVFVGGHRYTGDIVFNDNLNIVKTRLELLEREGAGQRDLLTGD